MNVMKVPNISRSTNYYKLTTAVDKPRCNVKVVDKYYICTQKEYIKRANVLRTLDD
jgi:hypothetical protein